jgi:hypothetical protein
MMLDFDNEDTYFLLVDICKQFAVFPSSSLESEAFFRALLAEYSGDLNPSDVTAWLKQQVGQHFVAITERPRWIQNPEWPIVNGKPLIFAGQIDIEVRPGYTSANFFHDDTSFYVFFGQKMQPVVVTQQY